MNTIYPIHRKYASIPNQQLLSFADCFNRKKTKVTVFKDNKFNGTIPRIRILTSSSFWYINWPTLITRLYYLVGMAMTESYTGWSK